MEEKLKNKSESSTENTTLHNEIVEVWEDNFEEEMEKISELLEKYPYVSMDTEFPGICIQGEGLEGYQLIKANVDVLKLIQVGISLADKDGNTPSNGGTWQFNLNFDRKKDRHAQDSIGMLVEAGIRFEDLPSRGLHPMVFAEGLISSGLLMNDDIVWITFHGAFDFAYLLKNVTNVALPSDLPSFCKLVRQFFPQVYDTKVMLKEVSELRKSSLAKLAMDLDLKRIGANHQAGSDAELTLRCFLRLREKFFPGGIPASILGHIFGLAFDANSQNTASQMKPLQAFPGDASFYELNGIGLIHQYMAQQPIAYGRPSLSQQAILPQSAGLQNFRGQQYYYSQHYDNFQPSQYSHPIATFNSSTR